ncbi:hypothetical protein DDN72_17215 [Vibrio cholerae]|nr:hypothetical protein [Vibrio cholerae]EGR4314595.1 hypothetical protein [Vibrio cholerae]
MESAEFGDNQTNRNFLDFNVNFVHKIMNGMVVELGKLSFTKNDDDTYDIQVPVKWHVKNNAGLTYLCDKIAVGWLSLRFLSCLCGSELYEQIKQS